MTVLTGARERVPLAVYEEAEAACGSFGALIREGPGAGDAEREELKRK